MSHRWRLFLSLLSLSLLLPGCRPGDQAPPTTGQPLAPATAAAGGTAAPPYRPQDDPYQELRLNMVATTIEARGVADPRVLQAMRTTPRHRFVTPEFVDLAYEDHPLPIGYGQTISQPYIVAWMTELLELQAGQRVLEIGTGSGYQAAVLAGLGEVEVDTIEIGPELAEKAARRLSELGYTGIHTRQGDGYYGWGEEGLLFDAIIVTAAPDHVPAPLVAQLAEGGRLVIPIGPQGSFQSLWKFGKQQGELKAFNLGAVRFVPLTGAGAQPAPATQP